jgi:AcrR family transcriptional regulator
MGDIVRLFGRHCQTDQICRIGSRRRVTWYGRLVAAPSHDLRERKRTRTRLMIQAEALRLFAEKGYVGTTVEEIAFAAAISPRTFFRYFPTKEDVVLWDAYDPVVVELVATRPADEPPAEAVRAITREAVAGVYRRDAEQLLVRARLLSSVPELRARMLEQQDTAGELLATLLAERRGLPPDQLNLRVIASAFWSVLMTAIDAWQKEDAKRDLLAVVDQAIDALAEGLGELKPSSAPLTAPAAGAPEQMGSPVR